MPPSTCFCCNFLLLHILPPPHVGKLCQMPHVGRGDDHACIERLSRFLSLRDEDHVSAIYTPSCRLSWISSRQRQGLALHDAVADVELKDAGHNFANSCERLDDEVGLIQRKVLRLFIRAWVEEARQNSSRRKRADVAALVQIAERASQRQIIRLDQAAVLLADDVVNVAAEEGVVLVDEAVFAHALGPRDHLLAEPRRCRSCSCRQAKLRASFGQPHQVLQLLVVLKLRAFVSRKPAILLAPQQLGHALARRLGRPKRDQVARRGASGEEIDHFFVSPFHASDFSIAPAERAPST